MRIRVLQRPASYVRVNLGRWSSEGQESDMNHVTVLAVRRKYTIIVCQTDTFGPCEDQRSVGVKVYGSPGTLGWRKFEKVEKQVECASLGDRDRG